MEDNHDTTTFLAEHPRLIGVLFAIALFLTQVSGTVAGHSATVIGP